MTRRAMKPCKSNSESIRRMFSVDDNAMELQNDTRQHINHQEGVIINKAVGGIITPSPLLSKTVSSGGCNGPRPVLEPRISKFSVIEDSDRIIIHENEHELQPTLEDQASLKTIESYTLRERQHAINETHPFGIRIWKPALYKKQRSVQKAADEDIHETKYRHVSLMLHISNLVWSLTVGLFMFVVLIVAGVLVSSFGLFTEAARDYATVFFKLASYLLWPFGKVVYIISDQQYLQEDKDEGISMQQFYKWVSSTGNRLFFHQWGGTNMNSPLTFQMSPSYGSVSGNHTENNFNPEEREPSESSGESIPQRRLFGRGPWSIGRIVFYIVFHVFIQPLMMFFVTLTWLAVFTIPMSNIMWNLLYHCRRHPLALDFKHIRDTHLPNPNSQAKTKSVLLCTFRCAGLHYYKFTVDGTNIIVMNLIAIVFFTIFNFYVVKEYFGVKIWLTGESTIFFLCLLSIIPLAFYIGQAVASISAQTSMGMGAVLNAFFSTIVEVYLYCVALGQSKGPLVEGSMIGSILAAVLLLPGLSMCGGALHRKTQRYNPASAGVSSAMLIFSMMVMFVPTLLYVIYGDWELICRESNSIPVEQQQSCHFVQPPLKFDKMYLMVIKPVSIICALVLFLAYSIGLWFTLRTHAAMIWQLPITDTHPSHHAPLTQSQSQQQANGHRDALPDSANISSNTAPIEEAKGHEAPNWSRKKSTWILLSATVFYAIIAEILVSCVDEVLKEVPSLSAKFLGLTVFALVPNTTEFLNAISFAIHGNVALSMEIGSAYALQVCLLQIPALVIYSLIYTSNMDHSLISIRDQMFALVFPRWDLIACVVSSFLFAYLYAEGKSNYFKGSILILMYVVLTVGFYYQEIIAGNFWSDVFTTN